MNTVKRVVISAIVMLLLDFIYLSANRRAFENQVIQVQRVALQIKPLAAVACYVFLIFGLNYFILRTHRPIWEAFVFGLVIYGVYDTTTYALLKKWDLSLAVMDTLWGGALMAMTTMVVYHI